MSDLPGSFSTGRARGVNPLIFSANQGAYAPRSPGHSQGGVNPPIFSANQGAYAPRSPLLAIWVLMVLTFSAPGREGPTAVGSLDVIALVKVLSRVLLLGLLLVMLVRQARQPRLGIVLWCLLPFGLFCLWAVLSVLWSPLKVVSIGQALGLLVQVLMVAGVATMVNNGGDIARLLCHLCCGLLTITVILLAVFVISPDASGLTRAGSDEEGAYGIMHPTSAGATASLGILVLAAARLLWGWPWTRWLLLPGLSLHGLVLVLATSRTALILTAILGVVLFLGYVSRPLLAGVTLAMAVLVAGYLLVDPGLEQAEEVVNTINAYLRRGESEEQIKSFTGRTDLWEAIWASYLQAPLIGHGYFVTSHDGLLDVWSGPSNHTAHNALLQVLVSTGLVGALLFVWGLARPLLASCRGLLRDATDHRLGVFLFFVGCWFLAWSQLCESFMGPIQPETVVFYSLLGLALSRAEIVKGPPLSSEARGE